MSIESFKVVLVGESGVGKTSIITQFIDQTFQEDIQSTTGGTFSTKSVVCDGGKVLKFEIWDTAGQEKYRSLTTMFYQNILHYYYFIYIYILNFNILNLNI